jgi:hypothetical protein
MKRSSLALLSAIMTMTMSGVFAADDSKSKQTTPPAASTTPAAPSAATAVPPAGKAASTQPGDTTKKCETKADTKKIAAANRAKFVDKCVKKAACKAEGKQKKLEGAGLDSFLKSCMGAPKK